MDKTLTTATVAIIAGMIRVLAMCVSYVEATLALAIPNAPIVDTILASVGPDCRNYPCTCCPNCGNDPCTCDDENTEPDNPDDCNGPKCPICGGLIVDDVATRASVSCQICDGDPCAVCGKRHCNEVHTNDPCSKSQLLSGDADFRNKVDLFFDKNQTEYFEDGWLKTSTGEYISPSNRTESSLSYDYSRQVAGKLITEHYHCHPAITGSKLYNITK